MQAGTSRFRAELSGNIDGLKWPIGTYEMFFTGKFKLLPLTLSRLTMPKMPYSAGTITENSSIALKENIFDLNTTLDKINRVRPVKYNKKVS